MPLNSILFECVLQNLVVFNILVLMLGSPLDLGQTEGSWVDAIHHLAVDSTSRTLLDFGKIELFNHIII